MVSRAVAVAGRNVHVEEIGEGAPLMYLHGIVDLHGMDAEPTAFHAALANSCTVIAPAHPGCAASDEDETIETIDDVVFHYLRVMDALGLDRLSLAGSGIGGWIAAEIAVRHPERIEKLALIGPTGLFVPGQPIADIFWYAQPDDGVRYDGLRDILFAGPRTEPGMTLVPDAKDDIEREMLKYQVFRFASLIGFKPPYLHNPRLRERLDRYTGPALVLWGSQDGLVPRAHADAYAAGFGNGKIEIIEDSGHSLIAEAPDRTCRLVSEFLTG